MIIVLEHVHISPHVLWSTYTLAFIVLEHVHVHIGQAMIEEEGGPRQGPSDGWSEQH
jgi:hypothetical protein